MTSVETDSYYCEICNAQFEIHSLYACYHGHFFCKSCYKQEYYKGKEQRCPHLTCNAWIDRAHIPRSHGDPARISNKMFPQPALYSENKKVSSHGNINKLRLSNTSLWSLSKRPLRCPHKDCNRSIAVASLDSHFLYEHKHVAFVDTTLESRNGLEFRYDDVKLNEVLCVVVIKITDKEYLPRVESRTDSLKSAGLISSHPILIVMATRLRFKYSETEIEKLNPEDIDYIDYIEGYPTDEKIFIWIGSNMTSLLKYTVAASTLCNGLRLKYYGPILHLEEDPRKLCKEGKGLILNKNRSFGMTDNGTKNLILDVLIHGMEDK